MLVVAEREQLPVPQARAGEPAAWDTLFKRYQLPLYVYVFELVHDEQTSLDVVQETFINAVRHIGSRRRQPATPFALPDHLQSGRSVGHSAATLGQCESGLPAIAAQSQRRTRCRPQRR